MWRESSKENSIEKIESQLRRGKHLGACRHARHLYRSTVYVYDIREKIILGTAIAIGSKKDDPALSEGLMRDALRMTDPDLGIVDDELDEFVTIHLLMIAWHYITMLDHRRARHALEVVRPRVKQPKLRRRYSDAVNRYAEIGDTKDDAERLRL